MQARMQLPGACWFSDTRAILASPLSISLAARHLESESVDVDRVRTGRDTHDMVFLPCLNRSM